LVVAHALLLCVKLKTVVICMVAKENITIPGSCVSDDFVSGVIGGSKSHGGSIHVIFGELFCRFVPVDTIDRVCRVRDIDASPREAV
jgi:hypothetical protein